MRQLATSRGKFMEIQAASFGRPRESGQSRFGLYKELMAALACCLWSVTLAAQAPAKGSLAPEIARKFARPHDLIDIGGGRKLNLFCMGNGDQTVLFDSGGSDWSVIWALVQPAVAKGARACSYDRAGLGYSDISRMPRSPIQIVEDLHALVQAAKLNTPLILVGHSLGGFNMKLYALTYPGDVAGLVLVDPSEERSGERGRSFLTKNYGAHLAARIELADLDFFPLIMRRYEECAAAARTSNLDPASTQYKRCSDPVREPLGPEIAAERARIQVTSAYQQAQASEISNSVYGDRRGDAAYSALFRKGAMGQKPLIVLTHGIYDPQDPLDAADFALMNQLHRETAALSTLGRQRVVPNTSHNIEIDDPQSIVDAVDEILRELDQRRK
ncbi:MAG: alpha/beta hydrolase [Sphingosinicella sp.]|nr:alpha/beta hydrolase [Sphingosinicella sp.]